MSPATSSHPEPEELAAFLSGKVLEETATSISQHLADCEACRTLVETLPPDTLVSLLRKEPETVPSEANPPGKGQWTGVETAATAPASGVHLFDVPADLAEHPRYRVLELLGSGGMGAVYKAEHRRMERYVALKVMNAALMTRPAMVERFHREVKAAARLIHPNIVTAFDADQAGAAHFLVMEYVEGLSLAQDVHQRGPLPVAQACDHIRQAALGLQHAFEHGMVHRDIKPHNLMLTPGGQVKILDFGLARFVLETAAASESSFGPPPPIGAPAAAGGLTEVGTLMGTADFIAPEQADDPRRADIRADIYSLGCTLYFLLAGRVPFPDGTAMDKLLAHGAKAPPPLAQLRPDLPPQLARVVERMMAKNPAERLRTPAEAAAALAPFCGQAAARRRRPRRLLAVAGLLAAAFLVAAVIYVQTDNGEFVIETNDENLAVMVNQKGVKIRDQASAREYVLKVGKHNVRAGQYEIDVSEKPDGVEFSTPAFKIQRGGQEKLVVTFKPKGDRGIDDPGLIKKFGPGDKVIGQANVTLTREQEGWRVQTQETRTIPLFEIANPGAEECIVKYHARMKTAGPDGSSIKNASGRAYLEMLCRLPGKGEFFSRGLFKAAMGTTDWADYEIPFLLEKGQRPDLIKLNLVIEGKGTVWIKDVELRRAPRPAGSFLPKDTAKPVKVFRATDKPLTTDRVVPDGEGWRIESREKEFRTVHVFEVPNPGVDGCLLIYRLEMKTSLVGTAYQELWCRFPGATDEAPIQGEFFSKGFDRIVSGNTDWISYEVFFRLEKNQRPDLARLDLVIGGMGQVWVKNVELVQVPLVP